MLVVAVISVDAYPFFGFSSCIVPPDSKETELGSSDHQQLHQQVEIPGQFYCHVRAWKCVSTAFSGGADIIEIPWCHLLQQMSSQ